MSTDYYAFMMVGIKLEHDQVFKMVDKEMRGCTHSHNSDYCPECGRRGKYTVKRREAILPLDSDWEYEWEKPVVDGKYNFICESVEAKKPTCFIGVTLKIIYVPGKSEDLKFDALSAAFYKSIELVNYLNGFGIDVTRDDVKIHLIGVMSC